MSNVESEAIGYVLDRIPNGSVFESFGKQFLAAAIESLDFVPIGGTKDGGIDGLEYTWTASRRLNKTIYQFSVEAEPRVKIVKTLKRLEETVPGVTRVIYATNQTVRDQHQIIDMAYDDYEVQLTIYDREWFAVHTNESPKTIHVFRKLEQQYIHAYSRSETIVPAFDSKDPRIYVFLRQQIENKDRDYKTKSTVHLDDILIDSLILLALDGTDPDKKILRSEQEIMHRVLEITDINASWVAEILPRRLQVLSEKPERRIRHHKKDAGYCLPYETRHQITERNIADLALLEHFRFSVSELLELTLKAEDVRLRNVEPIDLALGILYELFHKQGLEFAQFITNDEDDEDQVLIDQSLNDIVRAKISEAGVPPKQRDSVHYVLIEVFRKIIYNGDPQQKEFLAKLSNTYNMLFLLQIDPKLARYFERVAGDLRIYVDSSILIPAMAEYFLEPQNQRYTTLLQHARDAGITIYVNKYVIGEIENHLRSTKQIWRSDYEGREDLFNDRMSIIFVEEILIRAYFYSKLDKKIDTFQEFIEEFVTWNPSGDSRSELVLWLEDQFGVKYIEKDVQLDYDEVERLTQALTPLKSKDSRRARTDAKQLLTIYKLREDNNETSATGIFGYSTWWLTSDVNSQKAFQRVASSFDHNKASPYIRADYIYNYIALAPTKKHVDAIYQKMFPTLLGVNVAFHVPSEISGYIRQLLIDYRAAVEKPSFRGKLRQFIHFLKSDIDHKDKRKLNNFYDELKAEAQKYVPRAT